MGYHITYKTDNALNYGMAQRRNRLLLLASSKAPISFVDDREDSKTVYDVIGSLETLDAGSSSKKDRYHVCSNLSPINLERIKASKPGGTWNDWNEELLPDCFRKKSGKTYSSVYGRMDYYSVSPTLTTQFNAYGTGRFGHPTQNRAISIREGALLQSFPVNYDFVPEDEEVQISTLARQIGNAVPPRLGLHIGRNRNRLFGYIEFTIASI